MKSLKRVAPTPWHQGAILLLCSGLLFLLLSSLAEFWRMDSPAPHLAVYCLAAVAFGWLWWRVPAAGLLLVLVLPVVFRIAASASGPWQPLLQAVEADLLDYWNSLRVLGWQVQFSPLLGEVFLLLTGCALAPLFLRESLGRGSAFRAAALGAVIFGFQWAWFFDQAAAYFIPYLAGAFLLWAVAHSARRGALWAATGRLSMHPPGVRAALGAIALVTALASLLPANFAAMDLGPLAEQVQGLFPILTQLRGKAAVTEGRFTLATTGFHPNPDALGGPVVPDNTLALVLVVPQLPKQTIYLRGATFRIYNGRTWYASGSDALPADRRSPLPSHFSADVPVEIRTFEVRPVLDFGRTLFSVLEPERIEGIDYLADSDGNLLADQEGSNRYPYVVTARVPLYSDEQLRTLPITVPDRSLQPYLQIPASLPARVRNLAREITREAPHPYEKAVALETWLRRLEYDLDVPAPPAGRDFVDYFLFDLKRGYCTYFSTAMVIMLRELGIPARLVEGFAVSPALSNPTPIGKGVALSVTNAMAHAWVEAYFPSYGWVTFDPTPRGDLPLVDRSAPAPTLTVTGPGESALPVESEAGQVTRSRASAPAPSEGDSTLPDGGEVLESARESLRPALLWTGALLLLLATASLVHQKVRAAAGNSPATVQQFWVWTERLAARFGAERRPHETPREYARSLGQRWPDLAQPAAQMALDYERARYAPSDEHAPDPGPVRRARRFWKQVRQLLRREYGWWRYVFRRLGLPWPRTGKAHKEPPFRR